MLMAVIGLSSITKEVDCWQIKTAFQNSNAPFALIIT